MRKLCVYLNLKSPSGFKPAGDFYNLNKLVLRFVISVIFSQCNPFMDCSGENLNCQHSYFKNFKLTLLLVQGCLVLVMNVIKFLSFRLERSGMLESRGCIRRFRLKTCRNDIFRQIIIRIEQPWLLVYIENCFKNYIQPSEITHCYLFQDRKICYCGYNNVAKKTYLLMNIATMHQ